MSEPLTMSSDHPKDLLPDYVLGLLTPAEVAAVEAHLAGCAECQNEAWDLAEPLVVLSEALPSEPPPERLLRAVKAELAGARLPELAEFVSDEPRGGKASEVRDTTPLPLPTTRPSVSYAWPLAAAFAFVLALGGFLWGFDTYGTLQQVRADERLLSHYLARPEVQKVVLENVLTSDRTEPIGSALLVSERPAEVLFVLSENAPQGRTYQAWGHTSSDWDPEGGETLESLLTSRDDVFEVDAGGFASLYLSLEPAGGSPQPTNPLSKVSLLNPVANAPLEITTPEDGSTVSADSLIVSGALDPSIRDLSYTLNGGEPTRTSAANNRFSFTVNGLREGQNTLEVVATDRNGERVTASVQVTYTP